MGRKTWVLAAVALGVGVLVGRLVQTPPVPWKPVLEPSGFEYLTAAVDQVREAVEEVQQANPSADLGRAATSLRRLQRFYVPMTEVRQWAYDADRRYYLGDLEGAVESLERSRARVLAVAAVAGPDLRQTLDDVAALFDGVVVAVRERRPQTPERFRELGHRVNLLLLKGELALAGETFEPVP